MSQENVDMVQRAFEAWNRGDIEGNLAHLSSDVEGVPVGAALEGKVYRGHDEVRTCERVKRTTGLEPATFGLGSQRSTN
jgi:ketosteroid isomerase-like protein